MMTKIKYPVFIISKGRHDVGMTAKMFLKDKVPFKLVIEPQEYDDYARYFDEKLLIKTPFSNLGQGSIPVRNFCWDMASEMGAERHWVFDDNIRYMQAWYKGKRLHCQSTLGIKAVEKFTDRYTNIAISGMNYSFFVVPKENINIPAYILNTKIYSNLLIKTDLDFRWRGRYNEDTDLCLQALSKGYCTVQINNFMIQKNQTMTMKGGNMSELYQGDGRLTMSKSLEKMWPRVVTTSRKWGRPQHHIVKNWRQFNTPLIPRDDIDWDNIEQDKLNITATDRGIKSDHLKKYVDEINGK